MNIKNKIPIMRPLLPEQKYISPYLKEIDKNRWYSNFGPLVQRFEKRLEEFFSMPEGTVLSVANGTAGLTNALRAMALPKGSLCIIPSWTFMATAASAIASGLTPYFVDVDEKTWALDPAHVKSVVKKKPGKVKAVIVVSPFGAPIQRKKWDDFTTETKIPVIIDAAAGFDSVSTVEAAKPGKTPIMISMHATKVLGIGEGGIVISSDKELIHRMRELINFGFSGKREIKLPGTNAKMSEYSAAVGLAALDLWDYKKQVWMRLKLHYIDSFRKTFGSSISSPWLISDAWVSSVCNIRLPENNAKEVIAKLVEKGVESKQWWTEGCHTHPAYAKFPREDLPVTEALAKSVIGLPFSIDMSRDEIDYVIESLYAITAKSKKKASV